MSLAGSMTWSGPERQDGRDIAAPAPSGGEVAGRPAVRITLKVRYAPFFTRTFSRTLPEPTSDAATILTQTRALAARRQPDRAIRLLGVRLEMSDPATTPTP